MPVHLGTKLSQFSEEIHIICLYDEQTDVIHDNNKKLGFFIRKKNLDEFPNRNIKSSIRLLS